MVKNMTLVAMFAALTAVGAFIRIPFYPVPFTLQFLFVCLAGLLLGSKLGALSQVVYVAVGLIGAPIFAKGYGGIAYVLEPTFGYLIGFIICAFFTGLLFENMLRPRFFMTLSLSLAGMMLLYIPGVTYMYIMINYFAVGKSIAVDVAVTTGFLNFLPSGIIFCVIASMIAMRVKPVLMRMR